MDNNKIDNETSNNHDIHVNSSLNDILDSVTNKPKAIKKEKLVLI